MAIENKIEYMARDKQRQDIAWVRFTKPSGEVMEYNSADTPLTARRKTNGRKTDFGLYRLPQPSQPQLPPPVVEVNHAMSRGDISTTLPYIKREAVKALDQEYA
jgi:hypothetical protein